MLLPADLSRAVEDEIARFPAETLARAVAEISRLYRAPREASRAPHLLASRAHLAAYLAARLPATYAAARAVLNEIKARLPSGAFRSLLDLGAGPGTASWAAAELYPEIERVTLVEGDREMLELGRRLAGEGGPAALSSAAWQRLDLRAAPSFAPHDLVVAAYSLGELPEETARQQTVRAAWAAAERCLVLIEPGTPRGFSHILAARDELLARGAHLVAPCPHAARCPLEGDDWCHFAARVARSRRHRQSKEGTLSYEDEKFSYIAATRSLPETPPARILRHPLKRAGHIRLDLCTPPGRRQLTVSHKEKERWRRARKAAWGEAWED